QYISHSAARAFSASGASVRADWATTLQCVVAKLAPPSWSVPRLPFTWETVANRSWRWQDICRYSRGTKIDDPVGQPRRLPAGEAPALRITRSLTVRILRMRRVRRADAPELRRRNEVSR